MTCITCVLILVVVTSLSIINFWVVVSACGTHIEKRHCELFFVCLFVCLFVCFVSMQWKSMGTKNICLQNWFHNSGFLRIAHLWWCWHFLDSRRWWWDDEIWYSVGGDLELKQTSTVFSCQTWTISVNKGFRAPFIFHWCKNNCIVFQEPSRTPKQ